jgi:hypothetical protein
MDRMKRWLPAAAMGVAIAAMLLHGRIAQPEHYHEFADTRTLFGLPNAADVLSNIGFALVGAWGLWALRDRRHEASARGSLLFLLALVLTAFGSGFYHLAPDNARLFWDRLPIALACAGLLAAMHAETHELQPGWVLPALIAAAAASVLWWSLTESFGAGDLRPYLLLQGAPLVLIPAWQAIHGSPRRARAMLGIAILLYALAKVAELNDHAILDALGFLSGHTMKHLLAVAAGAVIAAHLVLRPTSARDTPGLRAPGRSIPRTEAGRSRAGL